MSNRSEHRFEFPAKEIAAAATQEADYHRERLSHWQERQDHAADRVRDSLTATLTKHEVTGGNAWHANVSYGNREAWEELQLASGKIEVHRQALDRYQTDAQVYATQGDRPYELDTDDVHHFRLGGQERPS